MKNQVYTGTPTSRRFANCPTTVKSGDFVLVGKMPAVAMDDYSSATGGTTFHFNGTFSLTVIAATTISPLAGSQVNPGDLLYASGGTLDATTNCTTGMQISKASGGTQIGELDPTGPSITSGLTAAGNVVIASI